MFDFDAGKLLVIGIVALIVIGPKELPRVLRQFGQTVGKLRRMAAEFQSQFMDAVKEAELDGIREDLTNMVDQAKIETTFDPIHTIRRELTDAMADRPTDVEGSPSFDMDGVHAPSEAESADYLQMGVAPVVDPQIERASEEQDLEPELDLGLPPAPPASEVASLPSHPTEPALARKLGGM